MIGLLLGVTGCELPTGSGSRAPKTIAVTDDWQPLLRALALDSEAFGEALDAGLGREGQAGRGAGLMLSCDFEHPYFFSYGNGPRQSDWNARPSLNCSRQREGELQCSVAIDAACSGELASTNLGEDGSATRLDESQEEGRCSSGDDGGLRDEVTWRSRGDFVVVETVTGLRLSRECHAGVECARIDINASAPSGPAFVYRFLSTPASITDRRPTPGGVTVAHEFFMNSPQIESRLATYATPALDNPALESLESEVRLDPLPITNQNCKLDIVPGQESQARSGDSVDPTTVAGPVQRPEPPVSREPSRSAAVADHCPSLGSRARETSRQKALDSHICDHGVVPIASLDELPTRARVATAAEIQHKVFRFSRESTVTVPSFPSRLVIAHNQPIEVTATRISDNQEVPVQSVVGLVSQTSACFIDGVIADCSTPGAQQSRCDLNALQILYLPPIEGQTQAAQYRLLLRSEGSSDTKVVFDFLVDNDICGHLDG